MSIIPKISVGMPKKREKRNLSYDCSTTSNIGNIQPTMCREMVPNEKYTVSVASLVRLASMPLPTFGRMSLRHHHVFVPIEDIFGAWNALLSGQHYKPNNGTTFIPSVCPSFKMSSVGFIELLLNYCDYSIALRGDLSNPYTVTTTNVDYAGEVYNYGEDEDYETYVEACAAAKAADIARIKTAIDAIKSYGNSSTVGYFGHKQTVKLHNPQMNVPYSEAEDAGGVGRFGAYFYDGDYSTADSDFSSSFHIAQVSTSPIMPEGADFILHLGSTYSVLLRLKPLAKRLRTIFIGLGYQFSPYNPETFNPFKLVAYYKAWFSLFRPDREKTWVDTNAYALVKSWDLSNGIAVDNTLATLWTAFLLDLMKDCFYYLPMDYYSMATKRPIQQNSEKDVLLNTAVDINQGNGRNNIKVGYGSSTPDTNDQTSYDSGNVHYVETSDTIGMQNSMYRWLSNPVFMQLAKRLLTFANKNTVIGRNIRDYLKVHYGISDPNCDVDLDGVIRIGSSRVNINISDVMSTAENSEGFLGEYAGKGIGYGDSEKFSFTADKFGYWICLTTVVPESGYYQGYLRENRHFNRFDFFTPEWDALGYQVLERGEIMDDYYADSDLWNPAADFVRSGAFGLVPRYSEYKAGRNIVNGDLSLPGLYNSMAPYTLDRRISGGDLVTIGYRSMNVVGPDGSLLRKAGPIQVYEKPSWIPSVVYDDFRKLDPTDHLGQYNRIFNYTLNDLDHFIIHNVFDVVAVAPMKSLSTSFDTYGEEDEASINVTKA